MCCSLKSTHHLEYKLTWLYDGEPIIQYERLFGDEDVTICQAFEKPLQEELFSCEVVRTDAPDDVKLFPFVRQSQGQTGTRKIRPVSVKKVKLMFLFAFSYSQNPIHQHQPPPLGGLVPRQPVGSLVGPLRRLSLGVIQAFMLDVDSS